VIIDRLREGKQPAYLGVRSVDAKDAKLDGHDVSVDSGAYVQSVSSGTPAAQAGLQVGDVVTKVDDKPVTSAASLGAVIRQYLPDDTVQIEVDRGGSTKTLTAKLSEAPSS
jgi:putative serine protease PepD